MPKYYNLFKILIENIKKLTSKIFLIIRLKFYLTLLKIIFGYSDFLNRKFIFILFTELKVPTFQIESIEFYITSHMCTNYQKSNKIFT